MIIQLTIFCFLLLSFFSCSDNDSIQHDQNKEVINFLFDEILNRGDLSLINKIFDINVIGHDATSSLPLKGIDRITRVYELFFKSFPDARYSIEDIISEGDKITVRWRITGWHVHDFMDMKASGNKIDVMGIIIYRLKNKKIVEYWGLFDSATLKKQITENKK